MRCVGRATPAPLYARFTLVSGFRIAALRAPDPYPLGHAHPDGEARPMLPDILFLGGGLVAFLVATLAVRGD